MNQILSDRYQLERRLGSGGMADVWLARDRALNRPVAVKILHPGYAADPLFVERFRREAQAAAGLNHPNIASVYDWGEMPGPTPGYYIVMEYIPGENLREIERRRGRLPEAEALDIAAEVAEALAAAHGRGIVHRDVKPHNVLIDPQGRVKVVDFGIARAAGASELTQTGAVAGTAQYLSPEQAQRLPVDGRSDLYSLGAVLYEMLTGVPPFTGDSLVDLALRHVREEPAPPSRIVPSLSRASDTIVLRALAKRPEDRYATAGAMRTALLGARREVIERAERTAPQVVVEERPRPVPAPEPGPTTIQPVRVDRRTPPPDSRKRSGAWLPMAAVLLLVALLVGGVLALNRARSSPNRTVTGTGRPAATARPPHATATATARPTSTRVRATVPAVAPAPTHTAAPTDTPRPTNTPEPDATAGPTDTQAAVAPPPRPTASVVARGAGSPAAAVIGFYSAVANQDFTAARQLWSPRLQAQDPPATYIDGRFANTVAMRVGGVTVVRQTDSTATVGFNLVETRSSGSTVAYTGTWQLVKGSNGWLLDAPNITEAASVPPGRGNDKGKGPKGPKGENG